jgi:hypothetical protein
LKALKNWQQNSGRKRREVMSLMDIQEPFGRSRRLPNTRLRRRLATRVTAPDSLPASALRPPPGPRIARGRFAPQHNL